MSDNLTIFGTDYTNVTGIKATGTNNGTLTYIRPTGTKSISANGTGIDVTAYASVDVAVPSGGVELPTFTVTFGQTIQDFVVTCDMAYADCRELLEDDVLNANVVGSGGVSVGLAAVGFADTNMLWYYVVESSSGEICFVIEYEIDESISVEEPPSVPPSLQSKSVTPTTSQQVIQPDSGYDGLSQVTVAAMPTGTAGTPTATKGTVSNHSVSVTPSVTNTTGYITGSTKTGTAVTVSASELVSGSETKTANGTYDVTNLASLVVNVASGGGGIGTLLNTTSIGTVSTTSTQASSLGVSCEVSGINSYDLLIVESSVNTTTNGRHAATIGLIFLTASSAIGTKNGGTIATAKLNIKLSSNGTATSSTSTTAYGIYPNSVSVSNGTATIPMYRRYNSTSTGTMNGTYTARVYGVKLYDLIGG